MAVAARLRKRDALTTTELSHLRLKFSFFLAGNIAVDGGFQHIGLVAKRHTELFTLLVTARVVTAFGGTFFINNRDHSSGWVFPYTLILAGVASSSTITEILTTTLHLTPEIIKGLVSSGILTAFSSLLLISSASLTLVVSLSLVKEAFSSLLSLPLASLLQTSSARSSSSPGSPGAAGSASGAKGGVFGATMIL